MSKTTPTWDAASVAEAITGTRFSDVRLFDQLDSTNRYLLDEARSGAPEGVVVVADHQTAGRGRLGRSWDAPAGASLLVSVLVRPDRPPEDAHLVTMAAGLAACDAVWSAAAFMPSLKWPNDLVVGRHKLAGMLSEAEVAGGRVRALVVGLGVNVNWRAFPSELADTATACSLVAGREVDRAALLVAFLRRLDDRLDDLAAPLGPEGIVGEYRQRCSTLGRSVRVETATGVLEGEAVDVTPTGHLVLEATDGTHELTVGDVVHLRPAPG